VLDLVLESRLLPGASSIQIPTIPSKNAAGFYISGGLGDPFVAASTSSQPEQQDKPKTTTVTPVTAKKHQPTVENVFKDLLDGGDD